MIRCCVCKNKIVGNHTIGERIQCCDCNGYLLVILNEEGIMITIKE